MNDQENISSEGINYILNEITRRHFNIISARELSNQAAPTDLLILIDVSKYNQVPLNKDILTKHITNNSLLEIDHHPLDKNTILCTDMFIYDEYSSVCEILTKLLCQFRIKFDSEIATYLYAGIYSDSNKLSQKSAANETLKWAYNLVQNHADLDKINFLFANDFHNNSKVKNLIFNNLDILTYSIACIVGEEGKKYSLEELATIADTCLKQNVDASFAIGNIKKSLVAICARSKGRVNVNKIIEIFSGEGNITSATANIENETPLEVKKRLLKTLKPPFFEE